MSLSSSSVVSNAFVRWLPLVAFCAVVAHHLWFVNSYAVNIPRQDDIFDFLNFVNQTEAAVSTEDAIKEWYSQYNDHRTNASRLVVYATYLIEGEVNFSHAYDHRQPGAATHSAIVLLLCSRSKVPMGMATELGASFVAHKNLLHRYL